MAGIPSALDSDAEDVAWALQTAEALWKRNERVDAIVWLRRAAQAAGEAEDDDRALALARDAAELAEWIAHNPPQPPPGASGPPSKAPSNAPMAADAVDDLLRSSRTDEMEMAVTVEPDVRVSELPVESIALESLRQPELPPPVPPPRRPSPPPPRAPSHPTVPLPRAPMATPTIADEPVPERTTHVPSAAEKHAGMLDPWAEGEAPTRNREQEQVDAPLAPPPPAFEPDEVVTSAPPVTRPPPARVPSAPAPLPLPPPPPPPRPPPRARSVPTPPPSRPATKPSTPPTTGVDLSAVEALSDLPDDAREAFARAATVQPLARDEEVSGFALALVLEGKVDVSATIVDSAARQLSGGAVIRARGTTDHVAPMRLVGASDRARVATWDDRAVEEAFRTCPWVEDELRAAGDRLQAEVGVTMGPLGEGLDAGLRADVTNKLTLRTLAEHEVFATRGKPIPGLLVVGAGELELVDEADVPSGEVLRPGDFVFPAEVLRAAPAPCTVRASKGGALVLFADRHVAQDLLVTYPPLLEIFAGS
ncbi:MAG TPA: hypothetical protein VIF15_01845 [Polyangiaceae bacterium]|jgi:hypothetical protein